MHMIRKSGFLFLNAEFRHISPAVLSSNALTCSSLFHNQKHWKIYPQKLQSNKKYTALLGKGEQPHLLLHPSEKWKDLSTVLNSPKWKLWKPCVKSTLIVHNLSVDCMRNFHSLNHHRFKLPVSYESQYNVPCLSVRELSLSPQSILNSSPSGIQPYLRLIRFDKPIGTWLLYWPCTWSIGLATSSGHLPDLWLLTLFGLGAFFMRGAGCIINDMWDRDIDKKVERTKLRPLASGELSMFQGLLCLGGMLSVSLCILLQLNWYSVFLGMASMGLVITYPLAKRFTYWPQALLGVTLNWGVLLSWSAIHGAIQCAVIPLYTACVLYTMIYDSIYSHQDKYDDMLIGVKSTALKFGDDTKKWLCGFSAVMVSGLLTTGIMCDQTWPYYTGLTVTAAHLAHQIYTVDLNNADDCARKFRSNTQLGFVMFLGIVLGNLMKTDEAKEFGNTESENKEKK